MRAAPPQRGRRERAAGRLGSAAWTYGARRAGVYMSRLRESGLSRHERWVGLRRFSLALRATRGDGQMQVREGMSEVVLTVGRSHTLREAAAMMAEKEVGAALVSDDETPVPCILTE